MLAELAQRGTRMALAHYDFGFGVKEKDVEEGAKLSTPDRTLDGAGGIDRLATTFDRVHPSQRAGHNRPGTLSVLSQLSRTQA